VPVERQRWTPTLDWAPANAQLRRTVEVLDTSARVDVRPVSASLTLAPTFPHTLVVVDTTAGNVTVTLPAPATVPGFRVEIKKTVAANTLTAASSANIDGAATLAWTTAMQSYSVISDGATYHVV
jgi:sRNA-binding carbon storage regulator CsrA